MLEARSFEMGAPGAQLNTLKGNLIEIVHRSLVGTSKETQMSLVRLFY